MTSVSFVHCIDTEGPLYENPIARIERVQEITGIEILEPPSLDLIDRLQRGDIDLHGKEQAVQHLLSSHRSNINSSWQEVDDMLTGLAAAEFREQHSDSEGRPWVFSWFCLDHVDYVDNPRRRDIGYHNIFDHYTEYCTTHDYNDGIYLHFHPMSRYREAHRCATSYSQSPHLYETFCRRIIDRNWFPSAFRAGFQAERPDSHLFLEQWVPFDFTNMSVDDWDKLEQQSDFRLGRSGNWRGAPTTWEPYHPHIDDHRKSGNCRRWIARCLNVMNRIAPITQAEIQKAFQSAATTGQPQIVAFCGHDFRDLRKEVEHVNEMILQSASDFPGTKYYFDNASQAFHRYLTFFETPPEPLKLDVDYILDEGDFPRIEVRLTKGSVFGPQPFLAIRSPAKIYYHDNFDNFLDEKIWHYAFSPDSIDIEDVAEIGVGCADHWGNTSVVSLSRDQSEKIMFRKS